MAFLFEFVRQFSTDLADLAQRIEDNMFSEPHASLVQARLYSEHLVKLMSKKKSWRLSIHLSMLREYINYIVRMRLKKRFI